MRFAKVKSHSIRQWILGRLLRGSIREAALEEFEELFASVTENRGKFIAFVWYCFQIMALFPSFVYDSIYWRIAVLRTYLKTGFRHFKRGKLFSFINIVGLSLGFTCAILIILFVTDELSYNGFHENADRIYSVIKTDKYHNTHTRNVPVPMGQVMKEYFPEIEHYSGFHTGITTLHKEGKIFKEQYTHFYPDFFNMFSFKLLQGSTESLLGSGNNVILTRSAALKYFGIQNAMGKTLELGFGRFTGEFTVAGICEDIPSNSTIKFDIILSALRPEVLNNWNWGAHIYIQLKNGFSPEQIEKRFPVFVKQYFAEQEARRKQNGTWNREGETITFRLQNIKEIYLNSPEFSGKKSNIRKSYIMSGIGVLIMFLACINFINLSIGRASSRAMEIGIRKLFGARMNDLIRQFWSESVIMISLSAILSLFTAVLILPLFNSLANKNININSLFNSASITIFVVLWLCVGFIAGGYSGLVLSKLRLAEIFKGKLKVNTKQFLMGILVIFQFSVSIFLIIATFIMGSQINYISHFDLGFNKDGILMIETLTEDLRDAEKIIRYFKNKIGSVDEIRSVTGCGIPVGRDWQLAETIEINRKKIQYNWTHTHYDYIKTMDMEIVEGRDFSERHASDTLAVVVNQEFVRQSGLESPVGAMLGTRKIIGVVKDYYPKSLRSEKMPFVHVFPENFLGLMLIKIPLNNIGGALLKIENFWKEINKDTPFLYTFLDEEIGSQYNQEKTWNSIVTYSTILALLITCMGLTGMTALIVSMKIKEIGIRKVLGASVAQVINLLMKRFLILITISNLIAWPASYYFMNKWLENYPYKCEVGANIFIVTGILSFIIAGITISFQAFKAANANPVDSLKSE